ncbi:tetratricopeptide repeat protein [Streptomyces sp. NPDC046853]|uniref:tetratricopeptide repeat protein n=1 Tax=Streptomyces sp. NPDC046853 TaxID=3154920 RepID=UPI0033E09514
MKFFRPRGRRSDAGQGSGPSMTGAIALYKAGRYAEAEAEARAVAGAGPRDDTYATLALGLTANATGAQGRHAEALAAYDAALPAFGRVFGAHHWQILKLRSERAHHLTALGRHDECEAEAEAVARIAARGAGPEMQVVAAAARNQLVFALNAQERHLEAEALARETLAALPGPVPDRMSLVLTLGLARSLNGQARHEEALTEAESAGKLRHRLPVEVSRPETGAVELAVATALLGLHRSSEARHQATAAHDACLASFGPEHRRTVEARTLLDRIDGV